MCSLQGDAQEVRRATAVVVTGNCARYNRPVLQLNGDGLVVQLHQEPARARRGGSRSEPSSTEKRCDRHALDELHRSTTLRCGAHPLQLSLPGGPPVARRLVSSHRAGWAEARRCTLRCHSRSSRTVRRTSSFFDYSGYW